MSLDFSCSLAKQKWDSSFDSASLMSLDIILSWETDLFARECRFTFTFTCYIPTFTFVTFPFIFRLETCHFAGVWCFTFTFSCYISTFISLLLSFPGERPTHLPEYGASQRCCWQVQKHKRQKDRRQKEKRQKDKNTKIQKDKKTKDKHQKESLILQHQGSFALLQCFQK